jgi:hypothetical protein
VLFRSIIIRIILMSFKKSLVTTGIVSSISLAIFSYKKIINYKQK